VNYQNGDRCANRCGGLWAALKRESDMFILIGVLANLFVLLCVVVFIWQQGARVLKWLCAKIDGMPSAMASAPVRARSSSDYVWRTGRIEPHLDRVRK
jgi:hypothetical protein